MKFIDLLEPIQDGAYEVDVSLDYLNDYFERLSKSYNLQLNPDFQRGHVWTKRQQRQYIRSFLSNPRINRLVYFNCIEYGQYEPSELVDLKPNDFLCVDGLQRLTALLAFRRNELDIDGHFYKDFTDRPRISVGRIHVNINTLKSKKELLEWYILLNSTGVPHTPSELARIREMIQQIDSENETDTT